MTGAKVVSETKIIQRYDGFFFLLNSCNIANYKNNVALNFLAKKYYLWLHATHPHTLIFPDGFHAGT